MPRELQHEMRGRTEAGEAERLAIHELGEA
jgi:hypothetical protein